MRELDTIGANLMEITIYMYIMYKNYYQIASKAVFKFKYWYMRNLGHDFI